jgi:hypothetical protein
MSDRELLDEARQMIAQGRTDAARLLLSRLPDHPEARAMLNDLNRQHQPPASFTNFPSSTAPPPRPARAPTAIYFWTGLAGTALVVVIVLLAAFLLLGDDEDEPTRNPAPTARNTLSFELSDSRIRNVIERDYPSMARRTYRIADKQQCPTQWGMAEDTWLVRLVENVSGFDYDLGYYVYQDEGRWYAQERMFLTCP